MLIRPNNRGIGRFIGDSDPCVKFLRFDAEGKPDGYRLVQVLSDMWYEDPTARRWQIHTGLVSDGASIPQFLWSVVGAPFGGPYFPAALFHDERYRLGYCTKDEADMLLWDIALCGGTPEDDCIKIVEAVSQFGQAAWGANAAKRAECGSDIARLLAWA